MTDEKHAGKEHVCEQMLAMAKSIQAMAIDLSNACARMTELESRQSTSVVPLWMSRAEARVEYRRFLDRERNQEPMDDFCDTVNNWLESKQNAKDATGLPKHDVCENSRDCIICSKRTEPAEAVCFSCHTASQQSASAVPLRMTPKNARALWTEITEAETDEQTPFRLMQGINAWLKLKNACVGGKPTTREQLAVALYRIDNPSSVSWAIVDDKTGLPEIEPAYYEQAKEVLALLKDGAE